MSHAWVVTNAITGLSTSAMTGIASAYLNDGRMDYRGVGGADTTLNLIFDLGSATALAGFALLNHNFVPAGATPTCTITGADNSAFTTNPVTAKAASTLRADAPCNKDHVLRFPSVTKRYWRLAFAFTASLTPRLGEVFAIGASAVTTLTRIKTYGHGEAEEYRHATLELESGDERRRFLAGPIRSKVMPFADLSTSQRDELMTLFRATRGGSTPLLWIENDNATSTAATAAEQECIYGRVQPRMGWREPDYNLYDVDAVMLKSLAREVGS